MLIHAGPVANGCGHVKSTRSSTRETYLTRHQITIDPDFANTLSPTRIPGCTNASPSFRKIHRIRRHGNDSPLLTETFVDVRQRHNVRFLVVGVGPGGQATDDKIRQLGLIGEAGAVRLTGGLYLMRGLRQTCVHVSDEEGFAQVLTEAMSVTCPVVTTDALGGGPGFAADNGEYGLLVPRGYQAKIAATMMERMLQPDVREQYSRLGQQRCESLSTVASESMLMSFPSEHLGLRG